MQTESRLQDLEARMSDAITLAAAAERSNQQRQARRGTFAYVLLDWACAAVVLPVQAGWVVLALPGRVVGTVMRRVEGWVGRKVRREMRTAGRGGGGGGGGGSGSGHDRRTGKERVQGRGVKKAA